MSTKIATAEEPTWVTEAPDTPCLASPAACVIEVKERTGATISERLVRDAKRRGDLPTYTLSGTDHYSPRDLMRWLHSLRKTKTRTAGV